MTGQCPKARYRPQPCQPEQPRPSRKKTLLHQKKMLQCRKKTLLCRPQAMPSGTQTTPNRRTRNLTVPQPRGCCPWPPLPCVQAPLHYPPARQRCRQPVPGWPPPQPVPPRRHRQTPASAPQPAAQFYIGEQVSCVWLRRLRTCRRQARHNPKTAKSQSADFSSAVFLLRPHPVAIWGVLPTMSQPCRHRSPTVRRHRLASDCANGCRTGRANAGRRQPASTGTRPRRPVPDSTGQYPSIRQHRLVRHHQPISDGTGQDQTAPAGAGRAPGSQTMG